MEKNKIILEAILTKNEFAGINKKEIAAKLQLPENSQKDLLFMSAILVSTGTNKNGATFLGSELVKARGSIVQKAIDIEHEEDKIIGHIVSSLYLNQDGSVIDDLALYNKLTQENASRVEIAEIDKMEMDIGIVCAIYRDRFPEIAEEIEKGDWKVSMECYYENFDLKVGSLIIPQDRLAKLSSVESKVNKDIKLVLAGKCMGTQSVSRVLRDISFCGCGIVKNPANERSIIVEAANNNIKQAQIRESMSEAAEELNISDTTGMGQVELKEDLTKGEVVQVKSFGYFLLKNGEELIPSSFRRKYSDIAKEAVRRTSLDKDGNSYYIVATNTKFIPREKIEINESSESVIFKTDDIGDIREVNTFSASEKEMSYTSNRWGPEDNPAGICISFEKYMREFPGDSNPGKIIGTHWCKLFNKPCPVFGASALDAECLRNRYSHMVRLDNFQNDFLVKESFNPVVPTEATTTIPNEGVPNWEPEPIPVEEPRSMASEITKEVENPGAEVKEKKFEYPKATPLDVTKIVPNIRIPAVSYDERKLLKDEEFAIPSERRLPIHTPERVKATFELFSRVCSKLTKEQIIELRDNLSKAALKFNLDCAKFKEECNEAIKLLEESAENADSEYGIPRLKLLPLQSRQQVISAMSRFRHLKVEISDHERKTLVVNILMAAKKFDVECIQFREKVKDLLN